jgi:hypothetical protein
MQPEERQIRAVYDEQTITVYQAYHKVIAQSAVQHQKFVSPPFKMDRMTWIKPSFLWMMYRCGWATKSNQEHVLAIRITRAGFDWALENACLSHFDARFHASEAAWKEELQHIHLNKLDYRAIQMGLSGSAAQKYVAEWIVEVTDITDFCKKVYQTSLHEPAAAQALIPVEVPYTPRSR